MDALAALLTRERTLVDLLVFKLVALRQLLLAGETRFLGWAAEEVERAAGAVRSTELERAVLVAGLAEDRGLAADAPLRALVEDAPDPWRGLLADTAAALRAGSAEVADLLAAVRRLAEAGDRALADTLRRVAPGDDDLQPALVTYGPGAAYVHSAPAPRVEHDL